MRRVNVNLGAAEQSPGVIFSFMEQHRKSLSPKEANACPTPLSSRLKQDKSMQMFAGILPLM